MKRTWFKTETLYVFPPQNWLRSNFETAMNFEQLHIKDVTVQSFLFPTVSLWNDNSQQRTASCSVSPLADPFLKRYFSLFTLVFTDRLDEDSFPAIDSRTYCARFNGDKCKNARVKNVQDSTKSIRGHSGKKLTAI